MRGDRAQRRHLIFADEAAIAFDIGMQDRGKLAGDAVRLNGKSLSRHWVSDRTLGETGEGCQSSNPNKLTKPDFMRLVH